MFEQLIQFLTRDVWRIPLRTLSGPQAIAVKLLRVLLTAGRRFNSDDCYLKASALTFYTLLSIVPVLAALFGIAKGFGLKEALESALTKQFAEQREVLEQAISFAHVLLDQTQGGIIAGVGVAFLLWTVIKLLGNIELSLNDIWRIHKPRSLARKFSDYLALIIVCPLFITASGGLNVALAAEVEKVAGMHAWLEYFSWYVLWAVRWTPYLMVWTVFSFLYLFVPNAKVSIRSGILGGVIAGTLYQMVQWLYITFQIGVAGYGAVYGSFAALPLFLVWLQTSWMIVLAGAEIASAAQNLEDYEFRQACSQISRHFKRRVSLLVAQRVVLYFYRGEKAPTALQLSRQLEIPIRLVRDVLEALKQADVLTEVLTPETEELTYQPAKDISLLTVKSVSDALDHVGTEDIPIPQSEEYKKLVSTIETQESLVENDPSNRPLHEL